MDEIFKYIAPYEAYLSLRNFVDDDCYAEEFYDGGPLENFLDCMIFWNYVWVASDNRVLLTPRGQFLYETLAFEVELDKKPSKVKRHYGKKHK